MKEKGDFGLSKWKDDDTLDLEDWEFDFTGLVWDNVLNFLMEI